MWDVMLALVLAVLLDWKGLLPKAVADRLAAILAMYAFSRIIVGTPLAAKLLGFGQGLADLVGRLVGRWVSPETATAISRYGLAVAVIIVGVLWIAAMLPAETTRKYGGDIVSREMSSYDIWGGALALTVGAYLVPGTIGSILQGITSLGVTAGQALIGTVS